ncbi:unnamed protein product [Lota lota]
MEQLLCRIHAKPPLSLRSEINTHTRTNSRAIIAFHRETLVPAANREPREEEGEEEKKEEEKKEKEEKKKRKREKKEEEEKKRKREKKEEEEKKRKREKKKKMLMLAATRYNPPATQRGEPPGPGTQRCRRSRRKKQAAHLSARCQHQGGSGPLLNKHAPVLLVTVKGPVFGVRWLTAHLQHTAPPHPINSTQHGRRTRAGEDAGRRRAWSGITDLKTRRHEAVCQLGTDSRIEEEENTLMEDAIPGPMTTMVQLSAISPRRYVDVQRAISYNSNVRRPTSSSLYGGSQSFPERPTSSSSYEEFTSGRQRMSYLLSSPTPPLVRHPSSSIPSSVPALSPLGPHPSSYIPASLPPAAPYTCSPCAVANTLLTPGEPRTPYSPLENPLPPYTVENPRSYTWRPPHLRTPGEPTDCTPGQEDPDLHTWRPSTLHLRRPRLSVTGPENPLRTPENQTPLTP